MRWTRPMVIEAIREARSQIQAFLRSESQFSYPEPSMVQEGLIGILGDLESLERVVNFKNQELPPKRERGSAFPTFREHAPFLHLHRHPSVKNAITNVREGWNLVRDGSD